MNPDRPLIEISSGASVINIFVGDKFDIDTLVDLVKRLNLIHEEKINLVNGRCLND